MDGLPRISVVIVTDHYNTIRRVLARLLEQTAISEVELILVLPVGRRDATEEARLSGFASVRFVELPSIQPVPSARAAGIRAASAPIVFLGETHSFPHPGFAAALIAAHAEDWDAVVPGIANANPESPWSWASFLMDYGMWYESLPAGPIGGGPTWNVAYRKSVLAEIDSRLDSALGHGDEFAVWFHGRGGRTWFEPGAKLDHANMPRFQRWAEQRYLCGLLVASSRRSRWSNARRLFYIAASPLIPAVIAWRLRQTILGLLREHRLPFGTLPAFVLGTLIRTWGEVVGYARGARPDQQPRMDHFEIHKLDYLSMSA